jgi:hypothetical protein
MRSMEFKFARASALLYAAHGFGQPGMALDSAIASPTAVATKAEVSDCFARVRGLNAERALMLADLDGVFATRQRAEDEHLQGAGRNFVSSLWHHIDRLCQVDSLMSRNFGLQGWRLCGSCL